MSDDRRIGRVDGVSLGDRVNDEFIPLMHDSLYGKMRDPAPSPCMAGSLHVGGGTTRW